MADEKPVIVVLNSGDLTAEEADVFKKQREKGNNTRAALHVLLNTVLCYKTHHINMCCQY